VNVDLVWVWSVVAYLDDSNPTFAWRVTEENHEILNLVDILSEIRTEHIPNPSLP
jgi:hypothetical protein